MTVASMSGVVLGCVVKNSEHCNAISLELKLD